MSEDLVLSQPPLPPTPPTTVRRCLMVGLVGGVLLLVTLAVALGVYLGFGWWLGMPPMIALLIGTFPLLANFLGLLLNWIALLLAIRHRHRHLRHARLLILAFAGELGCTLSTPLPLLFFLHLINTGTIAQSSLPWINVALSFSFSLLAVLFRSLVLVVLFGRQEASVARPPEDLQGPQFSLAGMFVLMTAVAIVLSAYLSLGQWLGMSTTAVLTNGLSPLSGELPSLVFDCVALLLAIRHRYRQPRQARLLLIAFGGSLVCQLVFPLGLMPLSHALERGQIPDGWMAILYALVFFYSLLNTVWETLILIALFRRRSDEAIPAVLDRCEGDSLRQAEPALPLGSEEMA